MLDNMFNKEVHYRSHGKDLSFSLSMGLFSSNAIDAGSRLLIDTLIASVDLSKMNTALDAGCGVGTLCVTLKALFPNLDMTATDRDALALVVSEHNAQKNGLTISTAPGLDTLIYDEESGGFKGKEDHFDLIMTNIPAKAGAPVLNRFLQNGLSQLTDSGVFAFVIVDTLADYAQEMCEEFTQDIVLRHDGKRHSVFIIRKEPDIPYSSDTEFPGAYVRGREKFSLKKHSYTIDTVYNIPGFDTIPYDAAIGVKMASAQASESLTIWNPGQGHYAMGILIQDKKKRIGTVHLAGRDLLALKISEYSVKKKFPRVQIYIHHLHSIAECLTNRHMPLTDKKNLLIITPDPVPLVPFISLVESSQAITDKVIKSDMIIASRSSLMASFSKGITGFTLSDSKKKHGFRAILFKNLY